MSSAARQRRATGVRPGARAAVDAAVEQVRLRLVPRLPRLGSRAPRMPFVGLVSLILLGGVIGLLLFNTSMQQASFTQSALQERASDLQARREALATEVEQLRDPDRIARAARRQGMVPAQDSSYLDLDTGAISGPLLPATSEDDITFPSRRIRKPAALDVPLVVTPVTQHAPDTADKQADKQADQKTNKKANKKTNKKSDKAGRARSGAPRGDRAGNADDGNRAQ